MVELTLKLVSVNTESANCYGKDFEKPNTMIYLGEASGNTEILLILGKV